MAKIRNFIYCLNVDITEDGRTDIRGFLDSMMPEYIPGLFSFSIHFSIVDISDGHHEVGVSFKNEDGTINTDVGNISIDYKKDEKINMPREEVGVNLTVALQNIEFKKSGKYYTQVTVDGEDGGCYPIYVRGCSY